jgi:fatty acid desaturase
MLMTSPDSIKYYLRPNSYYSFLAILRDWLMIGCIVWLNVHYQSIWLYIPSVWLIGAFQFALGESMLHDAAHHTLFTKKSLHYHLEFLYSLPFFWTVKHYRKEHLVHHSYLGKPKDRLVDEYEEFGFNTPGRNFFWLWMIKPITGYAGYHYLKEITLERFRNGGIKIILFWAIIIISFAVLQQLQLLVLYWLVPYFWSYYSYVYWSEVSDHYNTSSGTRSNLNPITNFITHNNGYHYLHHKYPTIPWFQLPATYKRLGKGEGDISYGFLDTYRQIRTRHQQ